MTKNFYNVLEVPRDVTKTDLVARFRQLVRERHPDRFQGEQKAQAELDFQSITEAFNVLRDPGRRHDHDREIDRPAAGDGGADHEQASRVFLKRGIRAYKEKKFSEAADHFDRSTQADPKNHQAWHHLALACLQEERWLPKGREAIVRACELKARHLPYLKLAGKIFSQSGMRDEAKEYYNQALPLAGDTDPSVRKALRELGGLPKKPTMGSEQAGSAAQSVKEKSGLRGKLW